MTADMSSIQRTPPDHPRGILRVGILRVGIAGLARSVLFSGCGSVRFFEKEKLADPIMTFDDDSTEAHSYQKVYYSMEGSAGGIGTTAAGGCGCY